MAWRSRNLGRAALFTAVALIGNGTPLTLEHRATGWSLAVQSASADSGRGGGNDRGGDGSGGGGHGSDSRGGGSGSGGDDRGGDSRGGGSGNGGDDRGGDSGGDSSRGSDDRGRGGDDRGGGGRGRGGDDASDDGADDGGQGHGRGRGRGGDEAATAGDAAPEDGSRGRGADDGRPAAEVDLSDNDLAGVLAGRRTLIDDRGRVLEVEIEIEGGRRTVSVKPDGGAARRDPGPITAVRAVDPQAGTTHGVRVKGAARGADAGARAAARSGDDGPRQVGDDLSRGEEESLIQGGWR